MPHPKKPGSYIFHFPDLSLKDAEKLKEPNALDDLMDRILETAVMAKRTIRENPTLISQIIVVPPEIKN